ncbi:hypothetical protein KBC80_01995 [Candidatus Woesebacteria bacterium]|nr:hypothetical protein [Candidatus Woesebacteria bacterium]
MPTVRRFVADQLANDASFSRLAVRYWKVLCLQGEDMDPEGRAGQLLHHIDKRLKQLPIVQESGASTMEYSRALQRFNREAGWKK